MRGTAFSVQSVPRCYEQDNLGVREDLVIMSAVREPLRFICRELLHLEAGR
jgi:hypothetical protein